MKRALLILIVIFAIFLAGICSLLAYNHFRYPDIPIPQLNPDGYAKMQECIAKEKDFWGERKDYEPNIVVLDAGDAENTRKVSQTIRDMGLNIRRADEVLGTIEVEVKGGQEIEWECYFLNSDLPIGNAYVNMEASFDV